MPQISTSEAIAKGLTAQHIATNLANYEAARSGFFVLEVHGLTNLLQPNYTGGINDPDAEENFMNADVATDILRLNTTSAPAPQYSVKTDKFTRGNDVVNFAMTPDWKDGTLTIDDLVGVDTKSKLYAWLRLAYDPHTFKGGRMRDYKKNCTLFEYTQDYELIRTWTLYGCFITSIQEGDWNKEQDGKRQLTANLVYDRATFELPEEENE